LLSRPDYLAKARSIEEAFSVQINQIPLGHTQFMVGLLEAENPSCEIVISGEPDSPDTREMLRSLRETYSPNKVVLLRTAEPDEDLFELVPVLREQIPLGGKATAYVCRNFQCNAPTTEVSEMLRLVEGE
jgi:uncharacterized protein YyaL (SSP411 family)